MHKRVPKGTWQRVQRATSEGRSVKLQLDRVAVTVSRVGQFAGTRQLKIVGRYGPFQYTDFLPETVANQRRLYERIRFTVDVVGTAKNLQPRGERLVQAG